MAFLIELIRIALQWPGCLRLVRVWIRARVLRHRRSNDWLSSSLKKRKIATEKLSMSL